ncbi:hypothetical protein KP509_07G089400 [Ceratopteris richardii]|uniref:mitogen-activated protein kinase n=1 Tax=Ceratopteris richardii TaxID=49495 RepID=A0A8T2UGU3_CERRI|nr:hypothetical protein KP509_07G089400 [Ceratopteris richardii]
MGRIDFFSGYSEGHRFAVKEVIGKGSYGVVCSAIDKKTGEKVAIKKIEDVFQHTSDAIRILREIKLLRLLRHPDIVEIKHILLPSSPRDFKDIYVVFELMESDLHQVILSNDDLTQDHFRFFLYQMLRALKFIHSAHVFHRDLKPKNILANSDCKLKICDFGLARVTLNGAASAIFWTDYVATRWYRAPELCGSFYTKYTTAVDIWSIGCIFAEVLTGQPLFPGRNVAHQLDLITDLLGTPPPDAVAKIQNEKARKYLSAMRKKPPAQFQQKFPNVNPQAVRLLQRLLAFDANDRPTAEEALADPFFKCLAKIEREPSSVPSPKTEFDFEKKHLSKDDIRSLIYQEILEYHPQAPKNYVNSRISSSFTIPSAVEQLRRQFDHAQRQAKDPSKEVPVEQRATSLPREQCKSLEMQKKTNLKEDHDPQCTLPGRNSGNRSLLGPHKVVPGESLKGSVGSTAIVPARDANKQEQSNVKRLVKNASLSLFQKVGSQHSHVKAQQLQVKAPERPEQSGQEETSNDKIPAPSRSKSMGSRVARLVAAFSGGSTHSGRNI